jgi:Outer membrane protein beta-barrel domain
MHATRWTMAGLMILTVAVPMTTAAQETDSNAGNFMRPNWNLFLHGGYTSQGRLLLQRLPGEGERALRGDGGFNVGGGIGVDFLTRAGLRLSYTYATTDLAFRQDDGDDSEALDVDNVGELRSHIAALEGLRYFFNPHATFAPYATAGLVGAWWHLKPETTEVEATDGSTQFRIGAIGTLGVKARMSDHFDFRLEMASATVRNPFSGRSAFNSDGGITVDEPTRVSKTDFRVAAVYSFGSPRTNGRSARRQ